MKAINGDLSVEQQFFLKMVELQIKEMTIEQLRERLLEATKLYLQQEQVIKALAAAEVVGDLLRACQPTEGNIEHEPGFEWD